MSRESLGDESEDSGIAVKAFGKDKVFSVFENSMWCVIREYELFVKTD